MAMLGVLKAFFLLLAVASVSSVSFDLLHESCNQTQYPALCLNYLRPLPAGSRTLAALSLETTRQTGNSTVLFAKNFINNFLASADRYPNRSTNDYRVLDCVSDCTFALNISIYQLKDASAVLDVDRKKARVLVQSAIRDVHAAICAEKDQNLSAALKFITKRNKVYKKLLRITIDLINLLKK